MSVKTTGSPDITILDSKIVADLCAGKFYVDVTPSSFIGDGADDVLGANVKIVSPFGITIKDYGPDYEINPGLSGGMDTVIAFNIPTLNGGYQLGKYNILVKLFDSEGNSWVVEKSVKVCAPNPKDITKKYGLLSAKMDGSCSAGKLYIQVDTPPNYSGKIFSSQVAELVLEYPTASGEDPLETGIGAFSVQLYEGVYLLTGETCVEYSLGDNVYVKVKYNIKKKKDIRCLIDLCCVVEALKALREKLDSDCTQAEKDETAGIIFDALHYVWLIEQSAACGKDSSEWITKLEELLGCSCTCNCADGTPIINSSPTSDFVIQGCGFDSEQTGLTKTYTFYNYTYIVEVDEVSQNYLTISEATLDGCTKTQVASFNIVNVYSAIKALATDDNDSWGEILNNPLNDVDPTCLGVTQQAWNGLTYPGKFQKLIDKLCEKAFCNAAVVVGLSYNGNDVLVTVEPQNENTYAYDIYLDGVFQGSILDDVNFDSGSENQFNLAGAANGSLRVVTVIPKCSNNLYGTPVETEFLQVGCPEVAPPSLSGTTFSDVECPFDLIDNQGLDPDTHEVHNQNNTLASTLVDGTALNDGVYYVFKKQETETGNCYSMGIKVTILCDQSESCTAPQNLTTYLGGLASLGGILQYFRFDSAVYPPPGNSYTAKKRLASDPDEPGSYTTLDPPVYNAGAGKWQFSDLLDETDDVNKKWIYRVESNCGGSPATTPYVEITYVQFKCSDISTTPHEDSIDYSFASTLANEIDKYEVSIYDSTGTVLLHTDTHTPVFSNPITGTFDYLDPETEYIIKVKACIGTTCNSGTCASATETTLAES